MSDHRRDHDVETPHAAFAVEGESKPKSDANRQDDLLDEGIEETFPASDPVSVKRIT